MTPIIEEFKTIPDFPSYSVSNHGRVRRDTQSVRDRYKRKAPYFIQPCSHRGGYPLVGLYHQSRKKTFRIHSLVARMFLKKPEFTNGRAEVNHKDGNKLNNHVSNLEWTDRQGNATHAKEMGLIPSGERSGARMRPDRLPRGEKHGNATTSNETAIAIITYRKNGLRPKQISELTGCSTKNVRQIAGGRTWKHLDYLRTYK